MFGTVSGPISTLVMLARDEIRQDHCLELVIETANILEYFLAFRIQHDHNRSQLAGVVSSHLGPFFIIVDIHGSPTLAELEIDLDNGEFLLISLFNIPAAQHTDRVAAAASTGVVAEKNQDMPGCPLECFQGRCFVSI
jgi:hypothetical protein